MFLFHLVMCLLTGGLWIPVMLVCIASNSSKTKKYSRKIEKNTRKGYW